MTTDQQQSARNGEAQRADFEDYAFKQGYRDFEQNEFGDYKNSNVNGPWIFWKAAQESPVSEIVPNQPVGKADKGRWATAIYYCDYWWVKKSHAERAIDDALEIAAQRCEQARSGLGNADRRTRMATLCANAIRSLKSATAPQTGEPK